MLREVNSNDTAMLHHLSICNIVLIEKLDLELEAGLTVFTGETGAGKSILLDSLSLALGHRSRSPMLRDPQQRASISALFHIGPDHPASRLATEHAVDDDSGSMILRRSFAASRGAAYLNDRPVGMMLLRSIGALVVQIEGQFSSLSLLDPLSHRSILDDFASASVHARVLARSWRQWQEQLRAWKVLLAKKAENFEDSEEEKDLCVKIATLDPDAKEEEKLIEKRRMMRGREKILTALRSILRDLEGDDSHPGVGSRMAGVMRAGGKIIEELPDQARMALESLEDARHRVDEGAEQLRLLFVDLENSHGELDRIEERLFALKELSRRCRVPVAELAIWRMEKEKEWEEYADLDRRCAQAEKQMKECRQQFLDHAREMNQYRIAAAKRFDRSVQAELPDLRLEKARFITRIDQAEEKNWNEHGTDRVIFEIAANPGLPVAPLHQSVSGGEGARIMLALRCVIAGKRAFSTLVFDEIDNGIGGAAAVAVGRRLRNLAQHGQVLCITHSPQVAGMAHHHFQVSKHMQGERTTINVKPLDGSGRREEISRLLAGTNVTDQARMAADQLIFSNEEMQEDGQKAISPRR